MHQINENFLMDEHGNQSVKIRMAKSQNETLPITPVLVPPPSDIDPFYLNMDLMEIAEKLYDLLPILQYLLLGRHVKPKATT